MDPEETRELRRDALDPKTRAVSDALDEYLVRIHGIFTSWAHPQEFMAWLDKRGYTIVRKGGKE